MAEFKEIREKADSLLRSRNVWRWHIVNMPRRQSVAEHTYLTWVIGMAFYDCAAYTPSVKERADFGDFLLRHDADESVLGDIPSPVKKALEAVAGPNIMTKAALLMGVQMDLVYKPEAHWLGALYKMADLTEALLFTMNNGAPQHVIDYLRSSYSDAYSAGKEMWPNYCDWPTVNDMHLRLITAK